MVNSVNNISAVNSILRNRYRVLHHLCLQEKKVNVIRTLGFDESDSQWIQSRQLLAAVMEDSVNTAQAINEISTRSGIAHAEVRRLLTELYVTGLLEFHITDICNLRCIECYYSTKSTTTFPFDRIARHINALNPRAITITGGGEPSVYHSDRKTMNDVIRLINDTFPAIQLGLINNNTRIPDGDWMNRLAWQRSSLDAVDRETYLRIKGRDKFDVTIENIYRLLASSIPFVGVGFLYRDENIEQIPVFLQNWFEKYQRMNAGAKAKFNIQFRPLSPWIESVTEYDISNGMEARMFEVVQETTRYAAIDTAFDQFLRMQTNFYSIDNTKSGSYFLHEPQKFVHCQNALLHRVLRSDGTEYPDFLLCNYPKMALGNVLTAENPDDERIKITLKQIYYYFRMLRFCNPVNCRQGCVSNCVETYLGKDISKLDLSQSLFF